MLALIAAFNSLGILEFLYDTVFVPYEVSKEINFKSSVKFGADIFNADSFLSKETSELIFQLS